MKMPFAPRRKKMMASTAAAATSPRRSARETEYNEEPNVRLSSAFVVVLILHVVAIGGIYAFSSIKAHQTPAAFEEPALPQHTQAENSAAASQESDAAPAPAAPEQSAMMPAANVTSTKTYRVRAGDTLARIASTYSVSVDDLEEANNLHSTTAIHAGQELKSPASSKFVTDGHKTATGVKDSGNVYTVVKGDNPVAIARKLHVTYDDLLKLNKIQDAKKLQIGQKLKVPAKHPAA